MTRLFDWLWVLPLFGYFGGELPVHDHSNSSNGGVLPAQSGTYTLGTAAVLDPLVLGGGTSVAHGLGQAPDDIIAYLECKTAEAPFVVGDRIYLGSHQDNVGSGISFAANATTVYIGVEDSFLVYAIPRAGGNGIFLTAANWKAAATPRKRN